MVAKNIFLYFNFSHHSFIELLVYIQKKRKHYNNMILFKYLEYIFEKGAKNYLCVNFLSQCFEE